MKTLIRRKILAPRMVLFLCTPRHTKSSRYDSVWVASISFSASAIHRDVPLSPSCHDTHHVPFLGLQVSTSLDNPVSIYKVSRKEKKRKEKKRKAMLKQPFVGKLCSWMGGRWHMIFLILAPQSLKVAFLKNLTPELSFLWFIRRRKRWAVTTNTSTPASPAVVARLALAFFR